MLSPRGGLWDGALFNLAAFCAAGIRAESRCFRRESKAPSGTGGSRLEETCGARVVHPVLRQAHVEQGAQDPVLGSLEDLLAQREGVLLWPGEVSCAHQNRAITTPPQSDRREDTG